MKVARLTPPAAVISIALVVGSAFWGCVSQQSGEPSFTNMEDEDQTEFACEVALIRLRQLIERRTSEKDFPTAVLLEASELYDLGKELYLEWEYRLALELIEEAIEMLEGEYD
jgi:lipoprotein NlpI